MTRKSSVHPRYGVITSKPGPLPPRFGQLLTLVQEKGLVSIA